jgi:DNA-binding MarR family transcriptional regulator
MMNLVDFNGEAKRDNMSGDRGLSYLIRQIELGVRRPIFDIVSKYGSNYAQYTALSVLMRRPGLISSELARRSLVKAQTMAETITALVQEGLVRREQDPDHGRQILLFITPAGVERVTAISREVRQFEDDVLKDFSEEEVATLISDLRRLRSAVTNSDIHSSE